MRGGMRMGAAAYAAMFAGTVAAGSVAFGTIASAAGPGGLPNPLAATAYDVGSNGYSQAVAIGAAFKNEKGVTLRLLPGKNDVSRQIPLRDGPVHFSLSGLGGSSQPEGGFVFRHRGVGPPGRPNLIT